MVKVKRLRTTPSRIVLELDTHRKPSKFKRSGKENKLKKVSQECINALKIANIEIQKLRMENLKLKRKEDVSVFRKKINHYTNDIDAKNKKTIVNAIKRARSGIQNPQKMQQRTKQLLHKVNKWDDVVKLYKYSRMSGPIKSIGISMVKIS